MNINENSLKSIIAFIKDLKFGEVIIKIQDSRVVSVEKYEKIRLENIADSLKGTEAKFNN